MGLYIKRPRIEALLRGKVEFVDDLDDQNHLSRTMLDTLIDDAEAEVELAMSKRYAIPFVGENGERFDRLPRSTQRLIKTLCELMAQLRVLEQDFGRGSAISGDAFRESLQKRYDELVKLTTERFETSDGRYGAFMRPPLLGLATAWHNKASDHGFGGVVLHSTMGQGDFPSKNLQDPSESWLNLHLDEGLE